MFRKFWQFPVGVVPEDEHVIVSTNRGEPLVLAENPSLAGVAFDNMLGD